MKAAITAGTVALCVILAGCGTGSTPGSGGIRQGDATPHATLSSTPSAAAQFPATGSSQPNGACPFLTQARIQKILGQRIHQVKGCYYTLPHGTDTIFFAHVADAVFVLAMTYSSPKQAQECIAAGNSQITHTYPGSGTRITKINNLGGEAEVATLAHTGLLAPLVRGAKELLVGIFWPPAATRSQLAVTLLRQAVANFGSYSAPEVLGCG
jgi:hypothetical protein